jgi:small-conductance mechanosensitive channel
MEERLGPVGRWLEALDAGLAEGGPLWVLAVVAAVSVAAWLLIRAIRFTFNFLHVRIAALQGTRIRGVHYGGQELFSQQEITLILLGLLRLVRFGAYAVVLYAYMAFALGLFSATRMVAQTLLGYVMDSATGMAQAAVEFIPSLIFLLVLFFVTRAVIKIMRLAFERVWTGRVQIASFPQEFAQPTFKMLRFLIIVFAIMVGYPYLPGAQSPAFQAVSIFLGLLVSLGSSGAIANIVSGIALTYMRAFRIGDRVKIADSEGEVIGRDTFVTRVRTIKNVDITIPNAMVLSNQIINFSANTKGEGLILHTTVTLGYDVEWKRAQEAMIEAALGVEGILAEPAPFVLQTALDDFYVHYELNAYTNEPQRMSPIYSALHRAIQDGLHAAGIEIASPHLSQLSDGNRPNLPDPYLPQDYQPAAGFRFLPLGGGRS